MHALRRQVAKAILVVMVANSCSAVQAYGLTDLSDYVCNKVSQVFDRLGLPERLALGGVAAGLAIGALSLLIKSGPITPEQRDRARRVLDNASIDSSEAELARSVLWDNLLR